MHQYKDEELTEVWIIEKRGIRVTVPITFLFGFGKFV
jgi:hypothetical protein